MARCSLNYSKITPSSPLGLPTPNSLPLMICYTKTRSQLNLKTNARLRLQQTVPRAVPNSQEKRQQVLLNHLIQQELQHQVPLSSNTILLGRQHKLEYAFHIPKQTREQKVLSQGKRLQENNQLLEAITSAEETTLFSTIGDHMQLKA